MDIETQLQFINSEIKISQDRILCLQAIKDTISGLVAPQLASMQPLIDKVATITVIEVENKTLSEQVINLTAENSRLTS